MHLVNRHRMSDPAVARRARAHPGMIAPRIRVAGPHHRGGPRRCLEVPAEGIGLEDGGAGGADHLELVAVADAEIGDEDFPIAAGPRPHRMDAAVPPVEVADDADPSGAGGPHGEVHAGANPVRDGTRAEPVVGAHVRALGQQVQVEVGQHRPVAIGIVEAEHAASLVLDAQAIVEALTRDARDDAFEQSIGVEACEASDGAPLPCGDDRDAPGPRPERPNHQAVGGLVRSQHRERVGVAPEDDGVDVVRQHLGVIVGGSRFEVRGSRFEVLGSRFWVLGSGTSNRT